MANKRILAFGASNSKHSINKKFATYAAKQIEGAEIDLIDLNDYEMPIFSVDRQKANGIPKEAVRFKEKLRKSDGVIISFAEHNGAYSAAFKNIFDWHSRIEGSIWLDKPMLLLSTSPGGRGGKSVLGLAVNSFKFMNKNTLASFSLPFFKQNFSEEDGILDGTLNEAFEEQLGIFTKAIANEKSPTPLANR